MFKREREKEGGRNRGRQGRGEKKREGERNERGGKEGGKKKITTEGREEVGRGKMDGWRDRFWEYLHSLVTLNGLFRLQIPSGIHSSPKRSLD